MRKAVRRGPLGKFRFLSPVPTGRLGTPHVPACSGRVCYPDVVASVKVAADGRTWPVKPTILRLASSSGRPKPFKGCRRCQCGRPYSFARGPRTGNQRFDADRTCISGTRSRALRSSSGGNSHVRAPTNACVRISGVPFHREPERHVPAFRVRPVTKREIRNFILRSEGMAATAMPTSQAEKARSFIVIRTTPGTAKVRLPGRVPSV